MPVPTVTLKPKRAQPLLARHPWVFTGAIDRVDGNPADGAEVDLLSSAGDFIARGLFNSRSKIQVRLYSWEPGRNLDRDFFRDRIERAVRLRDALGVRGPDRGCRLVFSEADGLSGCTIDEYAGWLTVQFTALAVAQRRELHDGLLAGDPPPAELAIDEHGLSFLVNIAEGQKTGFYHDQRDNRRA